MDHPKTQPTVETPPAGSSSDVVWTHSLREAIEILVVGGVFMVWTIGYSYCYGYGSDARTSLIFGIPAWAFWGIAVPWGTATLVSIAFAYWRIADDRLVDGQAEDDQGVEIHD